MSFGDAGLRSSNLTVPNVVTVLRIVLALVAAFGFAASRFEAIAVFLCILAALLDIFDGWYARRFAQLTHLGEHLDPLADKLLMAVVYGVIAFRMDSLAVRVLIGLIGAREIGMTVFRSYSLRRHRRFIPANRLGKLKMILQSIVGLTVLGVAFIAGAGFGHAILPTIVALVAILLISYVSAMVYTREWRAAERSGERQPELDKHGETDRLVVGDWR